MLHPSQLGRDRSTMIKSRVKVPLGYFQWHGLRHVGWPIPGPDKESRQTCTIQRLLQVWTQRGDTPYSCLPKSMCPKQYSDTFHCFFSPHHLAPSLEMCPESCSEGQKSEIEHDKAVEELSGQTHFSGKVTLRFWPAESVPSTALLYHCCWSVLCP